MKRIVPLLVGAALVVPSANASSPVSPLLKRAAARTGLAVRGPVPIVRESSLRFNGDALRILERSYPPALQQFDTELYMRLGLMPTQTAISGSLADEATSTRAIYDPIARVVRVRRRPAPSRAAIIGELARALVDQNFHLSRLAGLRSRDRDAALAAQAVVDGMASVASGARFNESPEGTPLDRFLSLEQALGNDGRALLQQLRYHGGRAAMRAALKTFPQTTEQLLHVDKFLQREPAQKVSLAPAVHDMRLVGSETFGEFDVAALLRTFALANADSVGAGWAGGRIGLYSAADGTSSVAIELRWDTVDDAIEWRAAASAYVAAAFPSWTARHCPAVDACWLDDTWELATVTVGDVSVFASGGNAELVAANLVQRS